jgi:hypothetical protein
MILSPAFPRSAPPRRRPTFPPRAEGLEGRLLLNAGNLDPSFDSDGYALIAPNGRGSLLIAAQRRLRFHRAS